MKTELASSLDKQCRCVQECQGVSLDRLFSQQNSRREFTYENAYIADSLKSFLLDNYSILSKRKAISWSLTIQIDFMTCRL